MEFTSDKIIAELQSMLDTVRQYKESGYTELEQVSTHEFNVVTAFVRATTGRDIEIKDWKVRWQ